MPNPDFLIVGASRSGTSSLFHYLRQHPYIYMPPVKEVHFFDFKFGQGLEWYQRQFKDGYVNGEASPYYLPCPYVPERVKKTMPNVKIIALCREPGARAYSHYWFNRERNEDSKPFLKAIQAEAGRLHGVSYSSPEWRRYSYLARGQYAEQLERWRDFDLFVARSKDLFSNTDFVVAQICDFLGVTHYAFDKKIQRKQEYPKMGAKARMWLDEYFEPYNERLKNNWYIWW